MFPDDPVMDPGALLGSPNNPVMDPGACRLGPVGARALLGSPTREGLTPAFLPPTHRAGSLVDESEGLHIASYAS